MVGNRRRNTKPELHLRQYLHGAGARYRVDLPIRIPGQRPVRPDVVFTRARVAVFVDGCFWHGCPEHGTSPKTNAGYWTEKIAMNQQRDKRQRTALEELGWTVISIWEHEPAATAAERILRVLGR